MIIKANIIETKKEEEKLGIWKLTKDENPDFKCSNCASNEIKYISWESYDGAYDDIHYICRNCGKDWWVESSDY